MRRSGEANKIKILEAGFIRTHSLAAYVSPKKQYDPGVQRRDNGLRAEKQKDSRLRQVTGCASRIPLSAF